MSSLGEQFFQAQAQAEAGKRDVKSRYEFAAECIFNDLFDEQKNAIRDPYKRKSVLTPRRAGKTHTAIAYAMIVACLNPDARIPIISLTLKSAKTLYWTPMQQLNERYGLGIKFSYADQSATFKNGAKIFLAGAESRSDIEKLRGGAYLLVIIDECKSFHLHIFEELLYEILSHATHDVSGTILIIGTPGAILDGPFYEATCPGLRDEDGELLTRDYYRPEPEWDRPNRLPRWSRHHWTVQANTFKPDTWQNALDDKIRHRWPDDHPIWVRESLGQWVAASETQVYALQQIIRNDGGPHQARCCWKRSIGDTYNRHGLSTEHDWRYVMGVDFGYEDDFALVVVAYAPTLDTMYHVHEYKAEHLTVTAIGERIKRTLELFGGEIEAMVADGGGLGKTLIESLNEMYDLYLEVAVKSEKFDFIELLNSDLYTGNLKILVGSALYTEMVELQFDLGGRSKKQAARLAKLRENKNQDNHLCDALLYTWRFCLHHFSRALIKPPAPETPEFYDELDQQAAEAAVARRDRPQGLGDEWTDDVNDTELTDLWTEALFN